MAMPNGEGGAKTPFFKYPDESLEWIKQGQCNDGEATMSKLFFSSDPDDIEAAKSYCQNCPVKVECLEFAMQTRQVDGVWGGESISFGEIAITSRKVGRPQVKS